MALIKNRTKSVFVDACRRVVLGMLCMLISFHPAIGMAQQGDDVPDIQAAAAVLIDGRTGRVLYGHNENAILPIASTTKVMTALLAIERCAPEEIVTTGPDAYGVEGTSIYLGLGEQLTMHQMLQGLMLRSANDAAVAIAEHIDGSVAAVAGRMNARAAELNAEANFQNPNGLDVNGNGTSALGLARIAREALKYDAFRKLVTTKRATLPWRDSQYDRVLTNKNKLLTSCEGATGVKTGFTKRAGRCLVFSAERDGVELIGVVLNCGNWFESAEALLDWGFDSFNAETIFRAGEKVTEVPLISGAKQSVAVTVKEDFRLMLGEGEAPAVFVDVPDQLSAPVERCAKVGRVWAELEGEVIAEADLIADSAVGEWGYGPAFYRVVSHWLLFT